MSFERYVLDTTVLEDYYIKKKPEVQKWLNTLFAQRDDKIVILYTIFLEFIRRNFYRKYQQKNLKDLVKILKRSPIIEISHDDMDSINKILKNLDSFPKTPQIHFGEFSLIRERDIPETVIVSSDKGALICFQSNVRLNPKVSPAIFYPKDSKFS